MRNRSSAKRWSNSLGYEIGDGYTKMDLERIRSLLEIPMPTNISAMRHFLGSAVFFTKYVNDFARLRAPLDRAISNDFDWSSSEAIDELRPAFEDFKQACGHCCSLFKPNWKLPMLVRCDASILGVGGVLLQLMPPDDPSYPNQLVPIAFCSRKFSEQAQRWSTWDQESFSIFYSVTVSFRHFLWGRKFVVENDHRNLMWMEASVVPKIVRWRLQLQDFDFMIRHIPGKEQVVADYFSRAHMLGIGSLTDVPSSFGNDTPVSSCYDWDTSFASSDDPTSPDFWTSVPCIDNLCLGHDSVDLSG
jgi:hypothetical protein